MKKESRIYILSAINFSINYRFDIDTHTCKFAFDLDNDNA